MMLVTTTEPYFAHDHLICTLPDRMAGQRGGPLLLNAPWMTA